MYPIGYSICSAEQIQLRQWINLDLSFNRFAGTLLQSGFDYQQQQKHQQSKQQQSSAEDDSDINNNAITTTPTSSTSLSLENNLSLAEFLVVLLASLRWSLMSLFWVLTHFLVLWTRVICRVTIRTGPGTNADRQCLMYHTICGCRSLWKL